MKSKALQDAIDNIESAAPEKTYLVPKDKDSGDLLPFAGLWRDDEYGNEQAEAYASKYLDITIARITLKEQS